MKKDLTAMVFEMGKKKDKDKPSESDDVSDLDEDEEAAGMGKEMAAEDILAAIESKDAKALATAIADLVEMCK